MRPIALLLRTVTVTLLLAGCARTTVTMAAPHVEQEPPRPPDQRYGLVAAAALVDITPPPGPASLGYSLAAKHRRFRGHQTRLRAYVTVLQDGRGKILALPWPGRGCPGAASSSTKAGWFVSRWRKTASGAR